MSPRLVQCSASTPIAVHHAEHRLSTRRRHVCSVMCAAHIRHHCLCIRACGAFVCSLAARTAPPTRDMMPSRSIIAHPKSTAKKSHDMSVSVSSALPRDSARAAPRRRCYPIHTVQRTRVTLFLYALCAVLSHRVHVTGWAPLRRNNESDATPPYDEVNVVESAHDMTAEPIQPKYAQACLLPCHR